MQSSGSHSNVAGVVVDKKFAQEVDSLANSLGQFFLSYMCIMPNEPRKNTGWLGYIGDYTTQLYRVEIKTIIRIPINHGISTLINC